MYKIVEKPRAWWPVVWPGVTEDGEVVENRIEMRFFLHSEDEFVALLTEARDVARKEAEQLTGAVTDEAGPVQLSRLYANLTTRIACDWRGIGAENGEPLPWSAENVRLLMNAPGRVFKATMEAYQACRNGGAEIRAGN